MTDWLLFDINFACRHLQENVDDGINEDCFSQIPIESSSFIGEASVFRYVIINIKYRIFTIQ